MTEQDIQQMFRTNSCKADEITTKNKENRKEDSNDSDININISRYPDLFKNNFSIICYLSKKIKDLRIF